MYTGIYYDKKNYKIHIWDDKFGYKNEDFKRKAFKLSNLGSFKTLYGETAERVNYWSKEDELNGLIYESDVDPATAYLIENYLIENDPSKQHRILFYDIEVEKDVRYSSPDEAKNRINAITAYDNVSKKYHTWILDEFGKLNDYTNDKVILYVCKSEYELLESFVNYWVKLSPTIYSGYNSDWFDNPYLINRLYNTLGETWVNKLSSIGVVKKGRSGFYTIAGCTSLDYLLLYKKFNQNEEPSYKLDSISKKELGRGKVEYKGNLQQLFETDIEKFIDYSIVDVELLVDLDNKLKFIDLVLAICHECHVPYEYIWQTSYYLDGAAICFARRKNICLPNKKFGKDEGQAVGAFVKDPKPGFYKWVFDLDLKALYPSTIQSYNISPETKMGRIYGWDEELYNKQTEYKWTINWNSELIEHYNSIELKKLLEEYKLVITTNGIIYRTDIVGLLPEMLFVWADERDEAKGLMKKYKASGELEKTQYYNTRQWVSKIKSNSLYGVLLLSSFRFYDKENGEAITISSQSLIQFTIKFANNYYAKIIGREDDYSIAGDTDSAFFSALPILEIRYPSYNIEQDTFENACKKVIDIATEIQTIINKGYDVYAKRFHNCSKHYFIIKQEIVSRRSAWVAKKRYVQWKIYEEGVFLDQNDVDRCLDVKGLDVVRSNFPAKFRTFMRQMLIDIVTDKSREYIEDNIIELKDNLDSANPLETLIPTSCKTISKWDSGNRNIFTFVKGTPVHYKASLAYNDFLKLKNLENYRNIEDGDKVFWTYLTENLYGIETIAIPDDDVPQEIIEFIEKYIDKNKIFNNILLSKVKDFFDAFNWGDIHLTKNLNTFF